MKDIPVKEVMITDVATISPGESVTTAAQGMSKKI